MSCFIGVYWLVAIFDIINAITIHKAKNVYLEQENVFKQRLYSTDQVGNMLSSQREEVVEKLLYSVKDKNESNYEELKKEAELLLKKYNTKEIN